MFKDKMVNTISNGIIDEMYTLLSDNGAMDIQSG
jgi:galactokinase/mevalonate kinase-like predicted kinase